MQLKQFLHRQAPVDSLCLYRAGIGALIFFESVCWLPYTTELFSNDGFHLPNLPGLPIPSPTLAFLLCVALSVTSLMMAVGLFTRLSMLSTLILWAYALGIDTINEKAAQTISIVVITLLLFSPCGNRYSLDAWLRRRRGLADLPGTSRIFVQRLLQIEFAQIYFFCGVAKMTNPGWVDGSAFYRIINGRFATEIGVFISSFDPDFIARAGGLGTILFELFIGFLLFIPPVRPFAIAVGVMFHTGIQLTLWVGSLGFHFILALLLLFPDPETISRKMNSLLGRSAK